MKKALIFSFLFLLFSADFCLGKDLSRKDFDKPIIISYAAGLNSSMNQATDEFRKLYPGAQFIKDSGGTLLLIRKITELGQSPDILFAADPLEIKDKLIPAYADWYIEFYQDRIVLAYTDKSKYTSEINAQNWFNVLLKKDVRFGYANPNLAPVGYRTLLSWQLADFYYKEDISGKSISGSLKDACLPENIRPDVAELLNTLESLYLDYAFVYESTAKQHNLKYINLPEEIDLGNPDLSGVYKQARVEITNKKGQKEVICGTPISFGLTILKNTSNFQGAVEFVKYFLGENGRKALEANFQTMLAQPRAFNLKAVPVALKEKIKLKEID